MTVTRSTIANWAPSRLQPTAAAIDAASRELITTARAVHSDVAALHDDGHWVGDAQRAAEDRAEHESRRLIHCAGKVAAIAEHYRSASRSIESARTHLLDTVANAVDAGATVDDTWNVTAGTIDDDDLVGYWRWEIGNALATLHDADRAAAAAIRSALADLHASTPESSGMSGLEARILATKIVADGAHLTDTELDRLVTDLVGARLSPEQRDALARGDTVVVPQGTLDYLQELYATLGVEGFVELSDHLAASGRPEARALLADGLALVADSRIVSTAETDTGGLPAALAEFFDGPAIEVDHGTDPPITITTVCDAGLLDRFARAYGSGDEALQQDNPVNRALIERAGVLASVDQGPATALSLRDPGTATFDGLLEHLVEAGGRDRDSVHDLVVDDTTREETILPLLQYDWAERGESHVAGMFAWIGTDALPVDDRPGTIDRAVRAGETAFGLSQLVADHHTELLDVPGADNNAIGEVNPGVTRALAAAVAPYLADMVGVPSEDTGTHGFGVLGKENVPALYAALASDPDAAEHLAGQVTTSVAALEQHWIALGPTPGNPHLEYGTWSGSLLGAAEAGVELEYENRVQDIESRGTRFDTSKAGLYAAASAIPVVGPVLAAGVDMLAPSVRDDYLDTADVHPHTAPSTSRSTVLYNLALGIQAANGGQLPDDPRWDEFRTDDGRLESLADIDAQDPDRDWALFDSAVLGELNARGVPIGDFNTALDDGRASTNEAGGR